MFFKDGVEYGSWRVSLLKIWREDKVKVFPGHQNSPKALYSMVFGPESLNT